jgi:transcriptional regulator with XRE-family HTH domain
MKKSGAGGAKTRSPTDVDRMVGENIRSLRIQRSLTLAALASELGLSHQQLQKYETGANRLSAGMLSAVAQALGVTIERLFRTDIDASQTEAENALSAMEELRTEGAYWLARARSEATLRQMIQVLRALSSQS